MGDKSDTDNKLAGQRKCVLEHAGKYEKYPVKEEKETALKTIKKAQKIIKDLRSRNPKNHPPAWQDTWEPGDKIPSK